MNYLFNLPPGRNAIELGPIAGAVRGTPSLIVGDAQNQVVLDTAIYALPMLLAQGFTIASTETRKS
jgi:hypothetical protein